MKRSLRVTLFISLIHYSLVRQLQAFPVFYNEETNMGSMQIPRLGGHLFDEVRANVDQVADNFFRIPNVFLKQFGNSPISHIEDFAGDALKSGYSFMNNSWETVRKFSNIGNLPRAPAELSDAKKSETQGNIGGVIRLNTKDAP
ncbi:hypothetical protein PPYR_05374 [Photinus pyralis]|uniref:Uncharacterized protein n=2 Tax=Photinus pyralis TaxID=7054 RepID=A0A5N4AUX9_PHOPY|nr:uncharacterized protein LOC116165477 [Photinus pyralis]KAB0801020.1 hypothetical protein PPYR_05374 [Photinus pyralis]